MSHGVVYQYGCQLSPHSEKSLVLFLEIKLNFLATDDESTCHLTLATCYQLVQSFLKIGFTLVKKIGIG